MSGIGRPANEDRLEHLSERELAAFLDGGLGPPERLRVEAHIDICDVCRGELVDVGRAIKHRGARTRGATRSLASQWWIPAAAAAGIVAILLVPRLTTRPTATDGQTRVSRVADGEGQQHVDLISPAADTAVSAALVLEKWQADWGEVFRITHIT